MVESRESHGWGSTLGFFSSLFLCITLISCSTPRPTHLPQMPEGQETDTVAIVALNDFHGALLPRRTTFGDQTIEFGGIDLLAGHLNILRSEFGSRLIVASAGDDWHGSLESLDDEGATVVQLFNQLGVQVSTLGAHDFNFGPGSGAASTEATAQDPQGIVRTRLNEAQFPFIATNLKFDHPRLKKGVILSAGSVRVGFVSAMMPGQLAFARHEYARGIEIEDPVPAIQSAAQALRAQGADWIVLLASGEIDCSALGDSLAGVRSPPLKPNVWSSQSVQGPCASDGQLPKLLARIAPDTVDAVISGQSHSVVHHWLPIGGPDSAKKIPVVQSGAHNLYYSVLYLPFRRELAHLAQIEGPIPLCKKVFERTLNCDTRSAEGPEGPGALIPFQLHGKSVSAASQITRMLEPIEKRVTNRRARTVGEAARSVTHDLARESEFGNLVADAIRAKTGADFALVNPGAIRADLPSGTLSFETLFRALPFDSTISTVRMTGDELKELLRIANCGARGVFSVSGLKLKLISPTSHAPTRDLNRNRKTEHWETNRLLDARTEAGLRLQNRKFYTVAMTDFLAQGGDDLAWIMDQIPPARIVYDAGGLVRDAVLERITATGPINAPERPLSDPNSPRVTLVRR